MNEVLINERQKDIEEIVKYNKNISVAWANNTKYYRITYALRDISQNIVSEVQQQEMGLGTFS